MSNRVYEDARTGDLKLCGFPDYTPVLTALQNVAPQDTGKQYQVTVKKHDRLVILQALASKWLETEFKDEVTTAIESHNAKYNKDGEYWVESTESRLARVHQSKHRIITPQTLKI